MSARHDLMVIDVMNLAHRGYWRARGSFTRDGRDNALERGLAEGLLALREWYPGTTIVLAWDGEPLRQREIWPGYKAGRAARHAELPGDWHSRCDRLREALAGIFPTVYDPHEEADFEIARLVRWLDPSLRALIVSTDGDLLMLLTPRVDIFRPGAIRDFYDPALFEKEFGFAPSRLVTYQALVGDPSDDIPGLPRLRKKVASRLAARFASVDELYGALRASHSLPVEPGLTDRELRLLRDGEAQVRQNVQLIDLLAVSGKPGLVMPKKDADAIGELLGRWDLDHLAGALGRELRRVRTSEITLVDPDGKQAAAADDRGAPGGQQ
jgi:DNA polymerase-1